jgi:hypothetical protein
MLYVFSVVHVFNNFSSGLVQHRDYIVDEHGDAVEDPCMDSDVEQVMLNNVKLFLFFFLKTLLI